MKKVFLLIFAIFTCALKTFCTEFDYQQVYRDLETPSLSFIHNMDPDQYYDCKDYARTPYPLFRLSSNLFFKNLTIQPGYYQLTPREYKGNTYILFKQNGQICFIIPTYKKDFVPEGFYDSVYPVQKKKFSEKFQNGLATIIGKMCKKSKRAPMPKSYLEVNNLDNNFVSIVIYYKEFRYYTIFRTVKL